MRAKGINAQSSRADARPVPTAAQAAHTAGASRNHGPTCASAASSRSTMPCASSRRRVTGETLLGVDMQGLPKPPRLAHGVVDEVLGIVLVLEQVETAHGVDPPLDPRGIEAALILAVAEAASQVGIHL